MVRPMYARHQTKYRPIGSVLHELLRGPGDATYYQVDVATDWEVNRVEKATVGGPTEIQMSN